MKPRVILYLSVAALALVGGMRLSGMSGSGKSGAGSSDTPSATIPGEAVSTDPAKPPAVTPESLIGQRRPPFTLGAADGQRVSVDEFDGQVLLVNFWATWCAPCREEMPMLVELQKQYAGQGLAVVGIALDDVAQARTFAEELGVNYTILVGGVDVMAASKAWGNQSGMLPYTVLVDRDGIVRWSLLGVLKRDELVQQVTELLSEPAN